MFHIFWWIIRWICFVVSCIFLQVSYCILWLFNIIFFFEPLKFFVFRDRVRTGDVIPISNLQPGVNYFDTKDYDPYTWATVHYSQKYYKNYYDWYFSKEAKEIKRWSALTYIGTKIKS